MPSIRNMPIFAKIMLVVAGFGVLFIVCMAYACSAMRSIDSRHVALARHYGEAAYDISRAVRFFEKSRASLGDVLMSVTEEGDRKALAGVADARKQFIEMIDAARQDLPDEGATIDRFKADALNVIDVVCDKSIKLGAASTAPADVTAAQKNYMTECEPAYEPLNAAMRTFVLATHDAHTTGMAAIAASTTTTILTSIAVVVGGLLLAVAGAYFAVKAWVSRPIGDLSASMVQLANQNLAVEVPGLDRGDEIGAMAKTVGVFKENGLRLRATEEAAESHRRAAEQERAANEARRAELVRQQENVVNAIADGLERLSRGDLTSRLSQSFAAEYEKLRGDFNKTADSLREAMSTIVSATDGISSGSDQIATASDDLSRRTEQQAANLEETAAALSTITATVKSMAADASEAAKVVNTTRAAAEASGAVVSQAIDAMGAIKQSSSKIGSIIGVIDEIAFQTSLLALNAGVEAARAGDAGRGFAVVASEVRALAQRSAEAAKEINVLITASTEQVEGGVVLVDKTGSALREIVAKVADIDGLVRQISAASQEQATSLAEINTAMGQMDQVVQQNAAMVEESTAAAHALKGETQDLNVLVNRFQIGDTRARTVSPTPAAAPRRAATSKPVPIMTSKPVPMMKRTTSAKVEMDPEADWKEF